MSLLDIIFPKYCIYCRSLGSYLCPNCFAQLSFDTHVICLECGKGSIDGLTHPACRKRTSINGVFCGVGYNHIAKKLIYTFKYRPYVSSLWITLTDLLYESLIQKELFMTALTCSSLFIPIPLASQKLKQRGYNQSLLITKGLAKKFSLSFSDCLQRTKETKPQFGLQKHERKTNIEGAFTVKKSLSRPGASVFLVDDVLTTGSTLLEAAKVLKQQGFRDVWGITFARD